MSHPVTIKSKKGRWCTITTQRRTAWSGYGQGYAGELYWNREGEATRGGYGSLEQRRMRLWDLYPESMNGLNQLGVDDVQWT